MRRVNHLRYRDVRGIFRLVHECCDLGGDPRSWRFHMFSGLCRLTGARVGIGGEMRDFRKPTQTVLQTVEAGKVTRAQRAYFRRYVTEDGIRRDPVFRRFPDPPGRLVTRRLEQLIRPEQWHKSEIFIRYMRPAGVDSRIISLQCLQSDPRIINGITLHRAIGDQPFGIRESRLVHLFHLEIRPLLGIKLAMVADGAASALPARLRQVLGWLMRGDCEKQVARRLGISQHTVHTYVNRLHRRFDVHSRGELLARCLTDPRLAGLIGGGEDRGDADFIGAGEPNP